MAAELNVDALNAQYALNDALRFAAGEGGLTQAMIATPLAEAQVYLHGAHVTAYQPRDSQPLLWLSDRSQYAPGRAIRGGIPIVFPWFGPRASNSKSPAHGFGRTRSWEVHSTMLHPDRSVEISFLLRDDSETLAIWAHPFRVLYSVRIGAALELALRVENTGEEPFLFEEALHTYLNVGNIRQAIVHGLEGTHYLDKVDGNQVKPQGDRPIVITGETDRVYLETDATCIVEDAAFSRKLIIAKEHSHSTVVWNPWISKAAAMSDFGDDEWAKMLCVETCNVGQSAITLAPGQSHAMRCVLSHAPI